jgi:hypothetical protein
MNSAGKLQTVLELYNNGFLCSCKDFKWDGQYDEDGEPIQILDHKKECDGVEKVIQHLGFDNK